MKVKEAAVILVSNLIKTIANVVTTEDLTAKMKIMAVNLVSVIMTVTMISAAPATHKQTTRTTRITKIKGGAAVTQSAHPLTMMKKTIQDVIMTTRTTILIVARIAGLNMPTRLVIKLLILKRRAVYNRAPFFILAVSNSDYECVQLNGRTNLHFCCIMRGTASRLCILYGTDEEILACAF